MDWCAEMIITIQHGLMEAATYPGCKKSSVVFNNEIIFTSATILEPYFDKNSPLPTTELNQIAKNLRSNKIVDSSSEEFQCLHKITFGIVFDRARIANKTKYLIKYKAKLLYIFNSDGIFTCMSSIIDRLLAFEETGKETLLPLDISKLLLSSVAVFQITEETKPINFALFLKGMTAYIQFLEPVNKLDETLTISTPFGLENFYKTVNFGKVSNVLGRQNCVFSLSNSLVEGCEGAAVFNNKLRLIGMVSFTSLRRGAQNVNLTLVSSFQYIFREFLRQIGGKDDICRFWKYSSPIWEKSIVLIKNEDEQGTGILTKIVGKRYILTCSHIVHERETTQCRYVDGNIECNVLWKNPKIDEPYDIALLDAPASIPDSYFVRISANPPRLGQLVYIAGFPFFTNLGSDTFAPSIFEGRIIKSSPGLIMSDASLQAGQSGGPMFDENGGIIGVCVCNIKANEKIYPDINIAVPLWEIKPILERYSKSEDIKVLDNLIAEPKIKSIWNMELPWIESKL